MTAEKFVPKPRSGNEDLLNYGNSPVEQLDSTGQTAEPSYDFSSPASYDRLRSRLDAQYDAQALEVVDAPVDQLSDDAFDTPIYAQLRAEQSTAPTQELSRDTMFGRAMRRMAKRAAQRVEAGAVQLDESVNYLSDTKELGELYAKESLRTIGRAALSGTELAAGAALLGIDAGVRGAKRAHEASTDAMINGLKKVESGLDTVGDAMNAKADQIKTNYQTVQFNRETRRNERSTTKQAAKELKAFDKAAARSAKKQARRDAKTIRQAGREDARFDRSMKRKANKERRASQLNALKNTAVSGAETAKLKYDSGMDRSRAFAERSRRRAKLARGALRVASQSGREYLEAFKDA